MALADDIAFVQDLLDRYAVNDDRMGVAAARPGGRGVPPEMQVGPISPDGWVEWRLLPSTVIETDVDAVEHEFGVRFPPLFRAYLMARLHLLHQVHSRKYEQLIFMTETPAGHPLAPLRRLLKAWRPIVDAGFVPFAEWGDGWGPMCFDEKQRAGDECPIVWMDHELLIPLGPERMRQRAEVLPLVRPLYESCRDFLVDVFSEH